MIFFFIFVKYNFIVMEILVQIEYEYINDRL